MPNYFSWLLKILDLKSRYLFGVCLFCSILIFSPKSWLATLGLYHILEQYRGWVGFVGFAVFIIWLVKFLFQLCVHIRKFFTKYLENKKGRRIF